MPQSNINRTAKQDLRIESCQALDQVRIQPHLVQNSFYNMFDETERLLTSLTIFWIVALLGFLPTKRPSALILLAAATFEESFSRIKKSSTSLNFPSAVLNPMRRNQEFSKGTVSGVKQREQSRYTN